MVGARRWSGSTSWTSLPSGARTVAATRPSGCSCIATCSPVSTVASAIGFLPLQNSTEFTNIKSKIVALRTIEPGDAVVGFPSAGVHANGFTLARRVLEEEDYDGADLLAPTRLYLETARALRARAKAFVHVTGGGIPGNLNRVLPAKLDAVVERRA